MRELFKAHPKDKLPLFILTFLFVLINLLWAFHSDNTWDDDCPARYQNTLNAFNDPIQFVTLWNRPLFVLIFALPVQLGAWTIPIIQSLFSIVGGFSLYKVGKHFNFKFSYLAFPLLALQPFVFGVSKYAMTEPLAITLICLSIYFQVNKKWSAFALAGALLPLARMELAVFFPFYVLALLSAKQFKTVLILGIPGLLWAIAGGILNDNLLWIIDETIGKESKENRYGHQEWNTYISRYAYVVGPVLMFFSVLGSFKAYKERFLRYFILLPFIIGFFMYTWFSAKANMGNAAGFLRNIIPISPFLAILSLAGINSWFAFASKRPINTSNIVKSKQTKNWILKAKKFNSKISNGKFYGFLVLIFSAAFVLVYYPYKLKIHHKITDTQDYTLMGYCIGLFLICVSILFLNRKTINWLMPSAVLTALFGYTLIIEHPMANSSEERQIISEFANIYTNSYLKERRTHVNHPWFIWTSKTNRYDSRLNYMRKDSLKKAPYESIALFETHYSNRLNGNVSQSYLTKDGKWVEISRMITGKRNFILSIYEKIENKNNFIAAHVKYIDATDSLDPAAFFCLGNTYMYKLRDFEKSYEAFSKAVSIDSTYSEGFLGLGMVMVNKRNFNSAVQFFNKGLESTPNNFNLLLQKGVALINMKQYNAAVKTLKEATKANKKDHQAWFYIGLAHQQSKQNKKAIEAYKKCLQKKANYASAWENVAILQYSEKNYKDACINIKKAVKNGSKRAIQLKSKICGMVEKN